MACHDVVRQVQTDNQKLLEFLIKQNTAKSVIHSLGSYLLKPIQRVLKYPLLLKKMCEECTKDRDGTGNTAIIFEGANHALLGAFKVMSELAGTINEVTRRTEQFGRVTACTSLLRARAVCSVRCAVCVVCGVR